MAFNSKKRKHSKPGQTTMRAFHFRIETNNAQNTKLHHALDLAWELRNDQATLLDVNRQEARHARLRDETPTYLSAFDLKKTVASDQIHPKLRALHSQVRQAISLRISEGMKRWFDAIKAGRKGVQPPKPIARKKFLSITYPQYGTAACIKKGRLHLSKLGDYRVIGWRKMRGAKKSVTLKYKAGHWWAIVMCEVQEADVHPSYAAVRAALPDAGVDPGITASLTDSYGESYSTPKALKAAQSTLRHFQRDVSRKFEVRKRLHMAVLAAARSAGSAAPVAQGLVESLRQIPLSKRLKRRIKKLARAHTKVERVRDDAAKKNARHIETRFARAAVEEHGLMFMLQNRRMAKAAADAGIGLQKKALKSAMGKGRYFEASNRRPEGGNSQTCLCGASVPKTLSERWHHCQECGLQGPRDQVSAIICQYETLGTLPGANVMLGRYPNVRTPGLGVLEQAVKLLKTRRGEGKDGPGESLAVERRASVASEPSMKRLSPVTGGTRNTAGGVTTSSAEANTVVHAGPACPCSTAAQSREAKNARYTHMHDGSSRLLRSPHMNVGE
jgi:putative transposase